MKKLPIPQMQTQIKTIIIACDASCEVIARGALELPITATVSLGPRKSVVCASSLPPAATGAGGKTAPAAFATGAAGKFAKLGSVVGATGFTVGKVGFAVGKFAKLVLLCSA